MEKTRFGGSFRLLPAWIEVYCLGAYKNFGPIGPKRGVLDLSEWSYLRVAGLLSVDFMGLVDADDCIA